MTIGDYELLREEGIKRHGKEQKCRLFVIVSHQDAEASNAHFKRVQIIYEPPNCHGLVNVSCNAGSKVKCGRLQKRDLEGCTFTPKHVPWYMSEVTNYQRVHRK